MSQRAAKSVARFLFIWLSFLGAALAYRHNDHVGLGFFVELIKSDLLKRVIYFIQQLCILFVLGFLSYYGVLAARTALNVSPALGISMSIVYSIVPIVSVMMVALGLIKLVDLFRGKPPDLHDHLAEEALAEFAPERQRES